jgi:hypothetical protein
MRMMISANLPSAMRAERSAAESPRVAGPGRGLQIAIHVVFGTPFLWCLLGALRGHLWWGVHQLIGDGVGDVSRVIWATTLALGSFWLGVSLMLMSSAARNKSVGLLLVLAGAGLLIAIHR